LCGVKILKIFLKNLSKKIQQKLLTY